MDNLYIGIFDKYIFEYTITMVLLSPFILFFFIFSIIKLIKNFKTKNKLYKSTILTILLTIALTQVISFWSFTIADTDYIKKFPKHPSQSINIESLYKLSINTSLFPAQKAYYRSHLGFYYKENKDYLKAIQCYEKVYNYTQSYTKPATLWLSLSLLYIKVGEYTKAEEIYLAVGDIGSGGLGKVYILQKNYPKAIKTLKSGIEKYPTSYLHHYHLALAYKLSGENILAEQYLTKAIGIRQANISRSNNKRTQMLINQEKSNILEYYNNSQIIGVLK